MCGVVVGRMMWRWGDRRAQLRQLRWSAVPLAHKCPISERREIRVGTEAK